MDDGSGGNNFIKALSNANIEYFGYLWFIILAVWGGTVNYINRVRSERNPFSLVELLGEWMVSGFAGLITAYLCAEMGFSFYLTAALTGISGHMGGRAIFIMERMLQSKLYWKIDPSIKEPPSTKKDERVPLRSNKFNDEE